MKYLAQGKAVVALAGLMQESCKVTGSQAHVEVCGRWSMWPRPHEAWGGLSSGGKGLASFLLSGRREPIRTHQACSLFNPAAVFTRFHF